MDRELMEQKEETEWPPLLRLRNRDTLTVDLGKQSSSSIITDVTERTAGSELARRQYLTSLCHLAVEQCRVLRIYINL